MDNRVIEISQSWISASSQTTHGVHDERDTGYHWPVAVCQVAQAGQVRGQAGHYVTTSRRITHLQINDKRCAIKLAWQIVHKNTYSNDPPNS